MSLRTHGHPQVDIYPDDQSKWPSIGGHVNWAPGENPVRSAVGSDGVFDLPALRLGNNTLGHMHLNLINIPLYAELSAPIRVKFSVVVFNADGEAFIDPTAQSGIRDFIFNDPDNPGTQLPPGIRPVMRAALGVEKTYTGTLVIDPVDQTISQFPTKHGWWNPSFAGNFRFDNGDHFEKAILPCFFSTVDTNEPEREAIPFVSARVSPHADTRHADFIENWGEQIVETKRDQPNNWLPIRPLRPGEVHRVTIAFAGYGADNLPPSINELRRNSKIHEHGGGIVEQSVEVDGKFFMDCVFDANLLGAGPHPYIAGRRQAGLPHDDGGVDGNVIQLVFNADVEGTVPPPQTVAVPDLVGKTEIEAASLLSGAGLVLSMTMPESSATVPKGIILSQAPAAQTVVAVGSSVMITVSTGPDTPPPIDKWEVVPTVVKRLKVPGGLDRFCLCVADETVVPFECVELVVKPDPEG
jgi:PASTA domain-containing protein